MERRSLGLKTSAFRCYLGAQFLGAFNDNAYKYLLLGLISGWAAGDAARENRLTYVALGLFALPFVLLAGWAGLVADRWRKNAVLVGCKLVELTLMLGATWALVHGHQTWLIGLLALMGVHSTFFGPAKYGWIGEMMEEQDLTRANAVVNMTTFAAIVLGQILGGALVDAFGEHPVPAGFVFSGIAVLGLLFALKVPARPAAHPQSRWGEAFALPFRTFSEVRAQKALMYTVLGIGHFFLLAALLQVTLLGYAQKLLAANHALAGAFVATALVGIALGSLLAGRWSDKRVELGLVPLGGLLMSLGVLGLALVPAAPPVREGVLPLLAAWWPSASCVLFLGAAGGLFIVPLNANLQLLAPEDGKGRYMAFGNFVSFIGVFLSAGALALMGLAGLSPREEALWMALLSLVGTAVSLWLLPYAFLRLVAWLLAHSVYRIRVLNLERIPDTGPALLVANHVSWVDWLILSVITRRRVHFLMQREIYEWWGIHWLMKLAGCIPVASGDAPAVVAASLAKAGQALDEGHVIGVFVEGTVTRTGTMQTIRRGYQRVLDGRDVPVIPIYLDGLWGSIFSHEGGKFLRRWPRHFPYPVTVVVGEPLRTPETWHLRSALQRLSAEAWEDRRPTHRRLHETLLRDARRSTRDALLEPGRPALSRATAITRALALRDTLGARLGARPRLGVLLPHGQDEVLTLLAVMWAGRVPVPLSPSLAEDELREALRRAEVEVVLTNAAGAARLAAPPAAPSVAALNVLALDVAALLGPDAAALRGRARRWRLLLWLLPDGAAVRLARRGSRVEDAALLFTAGRTGRAKAVPLEHHGVHCNVDAVRELLAPTEHDVIVSLLPTSLATGFAHGLWLPLLGHSRALLVPDPRDGRAVGADITHAGATILLATPRLLEALLHSAKPDHLGSLRLIIVLGEALRPALREALTARFGLAPIEALSSTECSGFIALGTPDVRVPGIFHRGSKPGSVGHPLIGLSLEVVDPQTGALRPNGEPGQLRVRGPSVVRGYLDDPELTARSFREGWFLSGEEALIDDDGFVTVTERFGRSTQFGAERVSHAALEEAILALLGTPDAPVVVVEAAGPRLVVVFVRGKLEPARVVEGLRTAGWHEPALPREKDFVAVDTLPLLPTGLLDLRALQRAVEGAV